MTRSGNRANCDFAITTATRTSDTNDVFHLNNVQTDRIKIQGWENKIGERWVTVELHGDDVVFEETSQSKDEGSDIMRVLREANPNMFTPHHNT